MLALINEVVFRWTHMWTRAYGLLLLLWPPWFEHMVAREGVIEVYTLYNDGSERR